MAKELLEGNAAMAEAAVRAGVEAYFGYPITPQTEVLEHLSGRLPELGRVFLQAESELASINMVSGARVMTSSSGPGISLMQEGLSFIACSEVPVVVVNVMRGGPGLGNVQPAQSDYFQAVRATGHGDFHPIALAPASVQEAIDCVTLAFDLAEKYRTIGMVVADGAIGQMMEPAELPPMRPVRPREERPPWALTGAKDRPPKLYDLSEGLSRWSLAVLSDVARFLGRRDAGRYGPRPHSQARLRASRASLRITCVTLR